MTQRFTITIVNDLREDGSADVQIFLYDSTGNSVPASKETFVDYFEKLVLDLQRDRTEVA